MLLVGAKAQFDQRARIRRGLRLPSVVSLIFLHSCLSRSIPGARRLAAQIVLANKCFLDLLCAGGIDLLLTALT